MDINLLVAYVKITTNYDSFAFTVQFKFLAVILKSNFILINFVRQSFELSVSCTWNIDNNKIKHLVLKSKNSSLLAVLWLLEIFKYGQRLVFRKNCNSRVTCRTLAEVPIIMVFVYFDFFFAIELGINLGLVDADEIRVVLGNEVSECIFTYNASYPIYIPHSQFQIVISFSTAQDSFVGLLFFKLCRNQLVLLKLPTAYFLMSGFE